MVDDHDSAATGSPVDGHQLLVALCGAWSLDRVVSGEGATMKGHAWFEPVRGALRYREEGVLTLGDGRTLSAHRRYRFAAGDRSILVDFADGPDAGRRFVELRFGRESTGMLVAEALHCCGDDRYAVTYRLDLPDAFETEILVEGPRKAYRAITRYVRRE